MLGVGANLRELIPVLRPIPLFIPVAVVVAKEEEAAGGEVMAGAAGVTETTSEDDAGIDVSEVSEEAVDGEVGCSFLIVLSVEPSADAEEGLNRGGEKVATEARWASQSFSKSLRIAVTDTLEKVNRANVDNLPARSTNMRLFSSTAGCFGGSPHTVMGWSQR